MPRTSSRATLVSVLGAVFALSAAGGWFAMSASGDGPAHADDAATDDRVAILPTQATGARAQWVIESTTTSQRGDEPATTKTTTRSGTVKVLDADEKILVIGWTEDAAGSRAPDGAPLPRPIGATVEFVVARDGYIEAIRNTDELRAAVSAAIDAMAAEQAARDGDEPAALALAERAKAMLDQPGVLRSIATQDVSPYFFGYGWRLAEDEPLTFRDQLPNQYGGQPLPVLASASLDPETDAGGRHVVRFTQATEDEPTREIMLRTLEDMQRRNGAEETKVEAFDFAIRDEASYTYDPASGWITAAAWERNAVAGDLKTTEKTTWRLTPMEPEPRDDAAAGREHAMTTNTQFATFGAGCFWGVEVTFRNVPGVIDAAVGYAGGEVDNPSYKQVCGGGTGHAEVVHVEFDPEKVSYADLVEVFFNNHNPTTLNRQGPDIGTQYRSTILYHSDEQKRVAEEVKQRMQARFRDENTFGGRDIVTTIEPFESFYRAEEYHQRYLEKRGQASCGTGGH